MSMDFPEKLIKGRIVETIFQQMFLDSGKYNVYPFGYESVLPQIAQTRHDDYVQSLIKDIRHIPDFVLTPKEYDGVYLVEVKYQQELDMNRVYSLAEKLHNQWTCPWLFIATQENFYFDSCSNIVYNNSIEELDAQNWIKTELQEYYISLLHKFVRE